MGSCNWQPAEVVHREETCQLPQPCFASGEVERPPEIAASLKGSVVRRVLYCTTGDTALALRVARGFGAQGLSTLLYNGEYPRALSLALFLRFYQCARAQIRFRSHPSLTDAAWQVVAAVKRRCLTGQRCYVHFPSCQIRQALI